MPEYQNIKILEVILRNEDLKILNCKILRDLKKFLPLLKTTFLKAKLNAKCMGSNKCDFRVLV